MRRHRLSQNEAKESLVPLTENGIETKRSERSGSPPGSMMGSASYFRTVRYSFLLLVAFSLTYSKVLRAEWERDPSRTTPSLISSETSGHPDGIRRSVRDPHGLCGGCRFARVPRRGRCGTLAAKKSKKLNVSLAEAATAIGREFPRACERCIPDSCRNDSKLYWRVDAAAPRINFGRTHMLSSIPDEFRIPKKGVDDLEEYFSNEANSLSNRTYLFEFNPTIVPLPADQIPDIPGERPVYLACYRVSKMQNCLDRYPKGHIREKKYAGFALLRSDLSVIQDAVVRLILVPRLPEDPRIFNIIDQLYVASYTKIKPIWLVRPRDMTKKRVLYNEFATSNMTIIVRDETSCCTSESCNGKNFNFFVDADNKTVVETLPMQPHIVERVNLERSCKDSEKIKSSMRTVVESGVVPEPSFYTFDELYFDKHGISELPYSRESGTTCCVRIPDPRKEDGSYLFVGVSHVKIPFWRKDIREEFGLQFTLRQYMSRFYAFEPRAPYQLVSVSGHFCMGYSNSDEEMSANYYAKLMPLRPFRLGETSSCPHITFLSGMTEKVDDPTKVLLSYGINDCTGRIVEIDKSEIVRLLFDPLGQSGGR